MARLHISQDDTGFWLLTFEDDDGALTLVSHQFRTPDHLIEDARELVEKGRVPGAVILIGPPRAERSARRESATGYSKPAPRRAVE
jgi:hypothetical protein